MGEEDIEEEKGWDYKNFIAPVEGLVKSVIGGNKPIIHTPFNEMVMGGISPKYLTGYQNRLEIEIISSGQKDVKKIIFNGNSPVLAEQSIIAYILKADTERLSLEPYYIPREFKEEETALYLEILGMNGKVLRRDYGVDIPKERD